MPHPLYLPGTLWTLVASSGDYAVYRLQNVRMGGTSYKVVHSDGWQLSVVDGGVAKAKRLAAWHAEGSQVDHTQRDGRKLPSTKLRWLAA